MDCFTNGLYEEKGEDKENGVGSCRIVPFVFGVGYGYCHFGNR